MDVPTAYLLPDGLPRPRLRGWLHLGAVPVAVALGATLVLLAPPSARFVTAVYGLAVVGLLAASATYHRGRWTPAVRAVLQRVDHAMIFVLIAGTYTPVCVLAIEGTTGDVLLAVVWAGAVCGVLVQVLPWRAPRWLEAGIYVALGWVAAAAFPALVDAVGVVPTALVIAGGMAYSAGAVVYARKRPDPVPDVFGYHEVFHTLTLVAAALHYAVIAFWVVPLAG